MNANQNQLQRLELKYLISEQKALAIRGFVSGFLELDANVSDSRTNSYSIHSTYMDSNGLRTYWDTINGARNRFKLRVRSYNEHRPTVVFFEIKRRAGDAIIKERCPARPEAVPIILRGGIPPESMVLSGDPRDRKALESFRLLTAQLGASPTSRVTYQREAWVGKAQNSVRVTLDRHVRCWKHGNDESSGASNRPAFPFAPHIVLELKFTGRHPIWLRQMVQRFNLFRCSAAKYVDGIDALGRHRFSRSRRRTMYGKEFKGVCYSDADSVKAEADRSGGE